MNRRNFFGALAAATAGVAALPLLQQRKPKTTTITLPTSLPVGAVVQIYRVGKNEKINWLITGIGLGQSIHIHEEP